MPALSGASRQVPWLCTDDLGATAATIFADPGRFIGQDLKLASDQQSINECRAIYRAVMGQRPPRFPMPVWIFERLGFVRRDLATMWRWLRTATLDVEPAAERALYPGAHSVEAWLRTQKP